MTPILPREILRIIYLLVREQEERPQRYRQLVDPKTLEIVYPRHSTFIALARVDMFAYQTVINEIFRPDRFLSRSRRLPSADVLLDALTQINTEDKDKGFGGGRRPTFDDPHVYPYLLRYHNLRRVTHVRIPTFRALALPELIEVKAFLAHIGEPGPLMRNVELSFAFNPTAADLTTSIRREWLELYAALFQPRLIVFEQIYDSIDMSLGSPIFAIARCFKHTPVRVYVRNAHVLVNGSRTRVQSADTHVQYICHEPQIDPALRDPTYLNSLFEFLRFHAISRPHSSLAKIDVVLPGLDAAEVSCMTSRLVDAEKREGPYRPRTIQFRSETSPTGYTERLRDVRLLTRFDSLGV